MNYDSSISMQEGHPADSSVAGSTVVSANASTRNSYETIMSTSPEKAYVKPEFGQHLSLDDMMYHPKEYFSDGDDDTLSDEAAMSKEEKIEVPYCIFSKRKKWGIVIMAAVATFISPLTANIFLPAMNSMQEVRNRSEIANLTIRKNIDPIILSILSSPLVCRSQKCKL